MKSALFFDIDGTIWNYDHYIPKSAKLAIRKARENGHLALLCSGRAKAFINHPDLLDIGFDGIVCSGGCHIEIGEDVVFEKLIEPELAIQTVEMIREYGFRPILEGPEYLYMDDSEFGLDDDYGNILRRDMGNNLKSIGGENYGKWHINKLSCATEIPEDKLLECYGKLEKNYEIISHNPYVCEIVPKGFSKATGMMQACKLLGIDMANTYAFGDSENDLEMLKAAGVGIAMGNGTDNAKAAADYTTTAFDEDGIFNACKHFGLI